jgi:site-specific recombinase XerD
MMNEEIIVFKEYLEQGRYMPSTIKGHLQNINYFFKWLQSPSFGGIGEAENVNYNDLLSYVQYEQKRNMDVATINLRLGSIKKYFDCLKQQGSITKNPAATLRIKGKERTVIQYPLKYEELQNIYHVYKTLQKVSRLQYQTNLAHQRNIIVTGLLVWQGLLIREIQRLEVEHININEGTIYIPGTGRSNSRILQLHTIQILSLHYYLQDTRNKLKPKADELIPGNQDGIVKQLVQELKGINPQIKNALHIRASVILNWLRLHNKRQVQYMAGHRYIDSTERYAVQEMETLTDQLTKHHPFG